MMIIFYVIYKISMVWFRFCNGMFYIFFFFIINWCDVYYFFLMSEIVVSNY